MSENSPYLGLRPFKENEQDKFFGRLPEIHILTDKILAHRLTLLVAASGVGKSSLLQAGVMPALRATGMADLIYHNDWVLNPAEALKKTIVKHFIAQQRVNADYQADFNLPLVEFLQIHALLGSGTMVILLDQFEEFFYYQKFSQQRDEFIRQLASTIHDSDTPTAFVFSMREDFAMEMEAFKPWFVGIFNNIYRIEKLDLDAARLAIVEPVKAAGFTYQPKLIELLLTDLGKRESSERLDLQHIDEQDLTKPLVEPPYLQIVCEQLWLKANASTEREITKNHYQALGGADGILKRHFDEKMKTLNAGQQRLASKAFDLLVSQHGAKMSYPLKDLASILAEDAQTLQLCLDQLQSAAILRRVQRRGEPWYELYHDAFAKTIMEWNLAYKRRQLKKTLIIRGGAAVLAGLLLWAADDVRKNYYARHFRLGKETVSDRVELYQGQLGSLDILTQQKFVYESDFKRTDIEADKRFETAEIGDLKQTAAMQIGQLPLVERFAGYAQAGLLVNADKVFDAIYNAKDKTLPSELPNQLSFVRVESTIESLQKLKNYHDSNVRSRVIYALGKLNVQAAFKLLLTFLDHTDTNVRQAAEVLGNLKVQDAIEPLLPLLEDEDLNLRDAAIEALGKLNAQTVTKSLKPFLDGKDSDARFAAIEVLGKLNAQASVESLLDLLEDKDVVMRQKAIYALGKLNAQAAIEPLLDLLENKDNGVRSAAIEALGKLNAQAAIEPLLDLLENKDNGVRSAAIYALGKLNVQAAIEPLLELLEDKDVYVRSAAIEALGKLNVQAAIEPLLDLLENKDNGVRIAAIYALGKLNVQAAIEPLLELLEDKDVYVRREAIEALGKLNVQAAIEPLLELLEDKDVYVRREAIEALGKLNAQAAIDRLLPLLEDKSDNVRQAAIEALGKLNAQAAIKPLLALLDETDTDINSISKAAIVSLKQLKVLMVGDDSKAPSPRNELIAQLKYSDLPTQQTAALALSKLPQPPSELVEWQNQQITELKLALKDGTASKASIASDLGYIHIDESVKLLEILLKDEDLAVVRNAIVSLGKIAETHSQWIQPFTQQFIEFSQNPYLQKAAIKALGQTIGPQSGSVAQQYLLKIARDLTQADDLRLAAVDALGNTAQPEIAALLFNLLQENNQATLHFTITYWLAKMPYPADKKVVILDSLQQRLSDLEKDKASWREQRDAYQEPKTDEGKPIVCFGKENTKADKTTWCDDYQIFQYAYAIARIDPQNAGIELLKHPLYQARQAAIRALAEKANGELLQNLFVYYQAFNWQDLPSPRPYATYRAIDKALQQLETSGTENDLKILQALKAKLIIPAKIPNPSDMEQQQDAMLQRFDWTIKESLNKSPKMR